MSLLFIDFEASSLDKDSWPIEIGFAWLDGDAIRSAGKLIRPDPDQPLKRLRKQHKELKKKLDYYFRAIEDGMLFDEVKDRMDEIKAGIAETELKLAAAEAETHEAKAPPPDPVVAYHEVLRRLEELLGHPDFVHQAHEHLAALIHRITLRPDPAAPDGMAAEILWDLGTLLSAGGYGVTWATRFRSNPQLTVGSGGSAPAAKWAMTGMRGPGTARPGNGNSR